MTQASGSAPGLLRVTVASSTRRVDLVLPGTVPVAELLPELARSVGLLDAITVHGGYRLLTTGGRRLSGAGGLAAQGVEDGALLTVAAGVDGLPPRLYDDVVEAMADVVGRGLAPWHSAAGRRTALGAALLLLALGAVALLLQRGSLPAAAVAGVVAAGLVAGAVAVSRAQDRPETAVAVAWLGSAYAALTGLLLVTDGPLLGHPVAAAGGGALSAGSLSLVAFGARRTLLLPPALVGAVFLATGVVVEAAGLDAGVVLTTALTLVVLAGSVFPRLALGLTGTSGDELSATGDADPGAVDLHRIGADARTAHEILVAISTTAGLLLVLVVPLAVGLGLAGTLLAVVACLVMVLRTRQHRSATQVLAGRLSGLAGLAAVAVAVLWQHPGWRPATAVALAAGGALLLVATLVPAAPSVRRARLGDVVESVCLLATPPLLVLATGLVSALSAAG